MGASSVPTIVSGPALVDLARQHLGEPYVFGSLAPKNNAAWKGPWDCAEFASWVLFQVAGILYSCNRDHGIPPRQMPARSLRSLDQE